jgi:hypothetical protein
LLPVELAFPTWCDLQRKEGDQLQPDDVLPLRFSSLDYQYWGTHPGQLFSGHSARHFFVVDEQTMSLLLTASQKCLGTEILYILICTLIHCFAPIFQGHTTPTVFVETHGREPVSSVEHLDLSETVGWFTSITPVELSGGLASSIVHMIKF